MKRLKGSVTIFLTALFATIVVVYTAFVDMLTYRASLKNAMNCNKSCSDYYGMMKNYDYENSIGLAYYEKDPSLARYQALFDEINGDTVSKNATTNVSLTGEWVALTGNDFHNVTDLTYRFMQYHVTQDDLNHYDQTLFELDAAESEIASAEIFRQFTQTDSAEEAFTDGFYNLLSKKLHYTGAIAGSKYEARNVMTLYGEGTGWTKADTLPSYRRPKLSEELQAVYNKFLSEKQYGPSKTCCHASGSETEQENEFNEINLWLYMNRYMTNASSSGVGRSGLKGEQEYILFGYRTDVENIARAAEEIMKYRFAANYYALSEYVYPEQEETGEETEGLVPETDGEAYETEEELPESRESRLLNHALRESYYDVLTLLAGGRIPTIKTADEFRTDRNQPIESIRAGRETEGLSYTDYLSYFILYSAECADMVNDVKCFMHLADWIEYVTGRDADEMYTKVIVKATYSTKIKPLSLFGALCNKRGKVIWDITIY